PLETITKRQAAALRERLEVPVFAGMRHSRPFIADAAAEARAASVHRLIGLPLAPHFARMSVGAYEAALAQAWSGPYEFIGGFHDHPAFIEALRDLLNQAMIGWRPERVFFTAHSLPARIVGEGDRYDLRLLETCELVAARTGGLPPWEFAFQSASHTGEPWLGPDLLEAPERSAARRPRGRPVGCGADHVGVLDDIDVEAQWWARGRGVELRRTASFNDRPEFIEALVEIVRPRLGGGA